MFTLLACCFVSGWNLSSLANERLESFPQDDSIRIEAYLSAAVDKPTPSAREEAARKLAKRDISLESWLEVMRTFGRFRAVRAGEHEARVELVVEGKTEATDLVYFVPESYDPSRKTPLIVAFHGAGGHGRQILSMWRGWCERLGMLLLCPSEFSQHDGYGFSERERQSALAALRWMRRHFNVDEDRIVVTGVSRGGHLCWDLGLRHPDRFAALAPMIGGPSSTIGRGMNNLRYLENIRHLPLRQLQGAKDHPNLILKLRLAFEGLEALSAPHAEYVEFPDLGHSFDFRAVEWEPWLRAAERDPIPERIVRRYARSGEGRAHWIEVLTADKSVEEVFTPRVDLARWKRLDAEEQQRLLLELTDERTARVEARWRSENWIEVKSEGVRKLRILLTAEQVRDRPRLRATFRGKTFHLRPTSDKEVLLLEFVERFDRRFLPVAEWTLA